MNREKADLPELTGLRGIAALLVLFFHLRTPHDIELQFGFLDPFSKYGFLGVDIFFVLSGYILCHVYGETFAAGTKAGSLRKYAIARFARIYPLHILTMVLMLGAFWVAQRVGVSPRQASGYTWESILLSVFLVQEWFGIVAPNPSSWSISVEFASYLLFPFIVGPLLKLPRSWPVALIIAGAVIVDCFEQARVLRSVTEFVMGCAAFAAARHYDVKRASALAVLTFILPFIASAIAGRELAGLTALSFTGTLLLLSGTGGREPFAALCASRPLVFLGAISYSVYLLQWFIWIGWKHLIAKLPLFAERPYVMVVCAATSVILSAALSFKFFESPMRSLLRQRFSETANARLTVGKAPRSAEKG